MRSNKVTSCRLQVAGWFTAVVMTGLLGLMGCSRQSPESESKESSQAGTEAKTVDHDLLLRVRFAGTAALMADTNAAYLTNIASLPETVALGQRIAERFASLPEMLVGPHGGDKSARATMTSNPFERLLADLLREGFAFELRGDSNLVTSLELLGRRSEARTKEWEQIANYWFESPIEKTQEGWMAGRGQMHVRETTNLVLVSLKREPVILTSSIALLSTEHSQANDLPSPGIGPSLRLIEPNEELVIQVRLHGSLLPGAVRRTQYGSFEHFDIETAVNESCLKIYGNLCFLSETPTLATPIEVPVNLLNETPISFTVLRNTTAWLTPGSFLRELLPTPIPEPAFFWGGDGSPFQFFAALPFETNLEAFNGFATSLSQNLSNRVGHLDIGSLALDTDSAALMWQNIGFVAPKLTETQSKGSRYLVSELMPASPIVGEFPNSLTSYVNGRTNLLLYDWEFTGIRMQCWLQLSQLMLFLTQHQQLSEHSASLKWILAAAHSFPLVSSTVTEITQVGPRELAFARRAPLGFTSMELLWLANWLESPNFPRANFLVPAPQPDLGTSGP